MPKSHETNDAPLLTWTAELRHPELERRFRLDQQGHAARQMAWVGGATAPFLLSFSALDYALFGYGRLFLLLLALRLVTAAALCALAFLLISEPVLSVAGMYAALTQGVVLVLLLAVAATYPASYLPLQGQTMTIYVLAVYLIVPNRWAYGLVIGLVSSASLLVIGALYLPDGAADWYTMAALLGFANLMGAGSSLRLHRQQRIQYHAVHTQRRVTDQLRRAADTDALTGLLTRRSFLSAAADRLLAAQQDHIPCSVLFLDVDHFKAVNDRFGHSVGDQCLLHITSICRACFRSKDLVGRLGGEEFAVLLEGVDEKAAAALSERLREQIENSDPPPPLLQTPTVTIGVAQCSLGDKDIEAALRRTDAAMYVGKGAGRNRVILASQQLVPQPPIVAP